MEIEMSRPEDIWDDPELLELAKQKPAEAELWRLYEKHKRLISARAKDSADYERQINWLCQALDL